MCRFYAFHANEPTKVECSLVHAQNSLLIQSRGDAQGRVHSDGWGIGYYPNGEPVIEKNVAAAHAGLHFSATAERVYARTVVAHVRLATVGECQVSNCHPFRWGNWIFAHNGTVSGVEAQRPRMLAEMGAEFAQRVQGGTDSELLFHWILGRLYQRGLINSHGFFELQSLSGAVAESIVELDRRCTRSGRLPLAKLNKVLTDGQVVVATRLRNSLYWVERFGLHDCEICGIPHVRHDDRIPYRAVVIASEPISDEAWQMIPEGSVATIAKDLSTTMWPLEERAAMSRP